VHAPLSDTALPITPAAASLALRAPAITAPAFDEEGNMDFSRRYLVWALSYAAIGMTLGIYMAASHDHGQLVTHAHVLMVGFVLSLVYGIIHRLWLEAPRRGLATTQFVLHQAAAVMLCVGLFLLYGGRTSEATVAPVLGIGSVGVLLGMLLMLYMVLRPGTAGAVQPEKAPA
jgi:hypothetical protein